MGHVLVVADSVVDHQDLQVEVLHMVVAFGLGLAPVVVDEEGILLLAVVAVVHDFHTVFGSDCEAALVASVETVRQSLVALEGILCLAVVAVVAAVDFAGQEDHCIRDLVLVVVRTDQEEWTQDNLEVFLCCQDVQEEKFDRDTGGDPLGILVAVYDQGLQVVIGSRCHQVNTVVVLCYSGRCSRTRFRLLI